MIHTTNLTFQYDKAGEVFNFPDMHINNNESVVILGESGIGKTTLLQILALLLTPKKGSIIIDDIELLSFSEKQKDKYRKDNIGIVFQKPLFFKSLTLLENIQAKLLFSKTPYNVLEIDKILTDLNILPYKHKKVTALSEGQKQRAGIALAIINKPSIILADEPTSNLDDVNSKRVISLLKGAAAINNSHLILVTHDKRIIPEFKNIVAL